MSEVYAELRISRQTKENGKKEGKLILIFGTKTKNASHLLKSPKIKFERFLGEKSVLL